MDQPSTCIASMKTTVWTFTSTRGLSQQARDIVKRKRHDVIVASSLFHRAANANFKQQQKELYHADHGNQ